MLRAVDLFCGAGGSTIGAEQSGRVKVVLAVNHWQTAIFAHESNHPNVRHICSPIDAINPRHDKGVPEFDLLLASPECTHHSIARGGKPVTDQKRATAWHVVIWAEAKKPKWIVVENVREFLAWGPTHNGQPVKSKNGETFQAWVAALKSLGYTVGWKILNAADYGEATKRLRLFVVARRGKGVIPWPLITHAKAQWRPAAEIIDWSRPCPSIFTRKRPLAEKTLRRIEIGLRKFVGEAAEPFLVKMRGTCHAQSAGEPLPSITAGGTHEGLAVPFLVKYHGGLDPQRDGSERSHGVDQPLPTLDTQPRFGLAAPFMVDIHDRRRDDRASSATEPLPTIVTKPGNSLVLPFLTEYYGTGGARSIDEPLSTVSTKHRHGLALVELLATMEKLGVVDIGFRMLDVDELAAAQGFPAGYILHGTKADRIKLVGNAVCPGVMRAICTAIGGAT